MSICWWRRKQRLNCLRGVISYSCLNRPNYIISIYNKQLKKSHRYKLNKILICWINSPNALVSNDHVSINSFTCDLEFWRRYLETPGKSYVYCPQFFPLPMLLHESLKKINTLESIPLVYIGKYIEKEYLYSIKYIFCSFYLIKRKIIIIHPIL